MKKRSDTFENLILWSYLFLILGACYWGARTFSDWRARINVFHYIKGSCLK